MGSDHTLLGSGKLDTSGIQKLIQLRLGAVQFALGIRYLALRGLKVRRWRFQEFGQSSLLVGETERTVPLRSSVDDVTPIWYDTNVVHRGHGTLVLLLYGHGGE